MQVDPIIWIEETTWTSDEGTGYFSSSESFSMTADTINTTKQVAI
jgi:hypothetical protein